jgi:threonine/homoserine/homoserine lactone efflux protein
MELLAALALFCTVTLFTPGPNNLMLMTSGLNSAFAAACRTCWA